MRRAAPNELQLRALAVVSECQNRPSRETSHSNWWLCIRQMHFYRVIHLSASFLPLLLAAMYPTAITLSCHTIFPNRSFFFFPLYTATYPLSLLFASVRKNKRKKKKSCLINFCCLMYETTALISNIKCWSPIDSNRYGESVRGHVADLINSIPCFHLQNMTFCTNSYKKVWFLWFWLFWWLGTLSSFVWLVHAQLLR